MDERGNENSEDERFKMLITRMKECVQDNDIVEGLKAAKKAFKIKPSDKLHKRIVKMEDYLLEMDENSEGEDVVEVGNGFFISKQLDDQLYPYQREGVAWMYRLFENKKGGILADDMGLGKTIQTITFLSGLFDQSKIKHVLVVLPATLMSNWLNEFEKWSPSLRIAEYHGEANSRQRDLNGIQRTEGVLITTYGLVSTSYESLSTYRGREFVWDYVILDEGHKIKNPTKCRTAVNNIPAKNRLLLTGTPIQNNLAELWSLFDFVHHGTLLGTRKTFKSEFETPITRSREKNASVNEKKFGEEMAKILMARVQPYLLRRTKAQLLENISHKEGEKICKMPKQLIQKNDLVIWLSLSDDQIRIYKEFLHSERVKNILMTKKSPLVELTILKKLCDHPRLLSAAACSQLGLGGEDGGEMNPEDEGAKLRIDHLSDLTLLDESAKMKFLLKLVNNLINNGHRILIFSQSRKMLDIIERILKNKGFRQLRLDGSIINQKHRQDIVNKFETNFSYDILLLTIQVGGVGLNLTSADRVVIFDPSWNPASDSQAVDRAYRIGQEKPVVVYRLITCSTVEEKIYRRQVFKESIYRETTGGCQNTYRYFTSFELKDMFTLDDPEISKTQMQLENLHSDQRKATNELDEHIAQLYSFDIFGISDNDLLFTVKEEENEFSNLQDKQLMGNMITRANKLMDMECELTEKARYDQNVFKTPKLPVEESRSRRVQKPQSPVLIDLEADHGEPNSSEKSDHSPISSLSDSFSKLSHMDDGESSWDNKQRMETEDKSLTTERETEESNSSNNETEESSSSNSETEESSYSNNKTEELNTSNGESISDNAKGKVEFEKSTFKQLHEIDNIEEENSPNKNRLSFDGNSLNSTTAELIIDSKIYKKKLSGNSERSFTDLENANVIADGELKKVDSSKSFDEIASNSEISSSVIECSLPNDRVEESVDESFKSLSDIDNGNSELHASSNSSLNNSKSVNDESMFENSRVEESDLDQSNSESNSTGGLVDISVDYDSVENIHNDSINQAVKASKCRRKSMLQRMRVASDSESD